MEDDDRKPPGIAKLEAAIPHLPRLVRARISFPFEVVHEMAVIEGGEGEQTLRELQQWWQEDGVRAVRALVRKKVQEAHDRTDERVADCIVGHVTGLDQITEYQRDRIKKLETELAEIKGKK